MPKPNRCPKCESTNIVADAHLSEESGQNVRLVAHARPEAKVFKKGTKATLRAMVCGACGYVELSVPDFKEFMREHLSKKD